MEYCYDCKQKLHSFERGVSVFVYEGAIRESMMKFKFYGREANAAWYVSCLLQVHGRELMEWKPEAILAVPIHPKKYRQRGYNQAEVLAECLAGQLHIPLMKGVLVRKRYTTAQKQLSNVERTKNLLQAFSVHTGKLQQNIPKRILLVDDIYTTGSTLEACTRVLQKAGIPEIYVATICIGSGYT